MTQIDKNIYKFDMCNHFCVTLFLGITHICVCIQIKLSYYKQYYFSHH